MLWNNLLRYLTGEAKVEEVAEQIAAAIRHPVWDRVQRQIDGMGPAEARGYVRARSAAVVNRAIDRVLYGDPTLPRRSRKLLIEMTTESLIRIVADQVSFAQAIPMVHAAPTLLRRAA